MPRKLRVEYAGEMDHVMSRGDRREDIFRDDEDRERFLGTVGEACEKNGYLRFGRKGPSALLVCDGAMGAFGLFRL